MGGYGPISAREFSRHLTKLFGQFKLPRKRVGIAVSGGVDSMALCTLLRQHIDLEGWPESSLAYTIDHRVRPESAEEAVKVAQWVEKLGFRHRILQLPYTVVEGNPMPGNIEMLLRKERYRLLRQFAKDDQLDVILTGHHEDDQYETVILRLMWGSSLAGLGGIPVYSELFLRPQLIYPKARLKATCELHQTPWAEDPTNSDVKFALRNAIRHIVQKQDDLPVALQRNNILSLAILGSQFHERLLRGVNSLLNQCNFHREAFTGKVRVTFPAAILRAPSRVLRNFIPALAHAFHSNSVERYVFRGSRTDLVSEDIVFQLLNPEVGQFTALALSFRKQLPTASGLLRLVVTPQRPPKVEIKPLPLSVDVQHGEWKLLKLNEKNERLVPTSIEISVLEDRNYYLRPLRTTDHPKLKLLMPIDIRIQFLNGLNRSKDYPRELFPLLCHLEGEEEIIDALPSFKIDLSSTVKTRCARDFDLWRSTEEWIRIEREREGDSQN